MNIHTDEHTYRKNRKHNLFTNDNRRSKYAKLKLEQKIIGINGKAKHTPTYTCGQIIKSNMQFMEDFNTFTYNTLAP